MARLAKAMSDPDLAITELRLNMKRVELSIICRGFDVVGADDQLNTISDRLEKHGLPSRTDWE